MYMYMYLKREGKRKNEEKEKVKKVFFCGRGKPGGHQMEKDGIGICSCYISWPALRTRGLDRMQ